MPTPLEYLRREEELDDLAAMAEVATKENAAELLAKAKELLYRLENDLP